MSVGNTIAIFDQKVGQRNIYNMHFKYQPKLHEISETLRKGGLVDASGSCAQKWGFKWIVMKCLKAIAHLFCKDVFKFSDVADKVEKLYIEWQNSISENGFKGTPLPLANRAKHRADLQNRISHFSQIMGDTYHKFEVNVHLIKWYEHDVPKKINEENHGARIKEVAERAASIPDCSQCWPRVHLDARILEINHEIERVNDEREFQRYEAELKDPRNHPDIRGEAEMKIKTLSGMTYDIKFGKNAKVGHLKLMLQEADSGVPLRNQRILSAGAVRENDFLLSMLKPQENANYILGHLILRVVRSASPYICEDHRDPTPRFLNP